MCTKTLNNVDYWVVLINYYDGSSCSLQDYHILTLVNAIRKKLPPEVDFKSGALNTATGTVNYFIRGVFYFSVKIKLVPTNAVYEDSMDFWNACMERLAWHENRNVKTGKKERKRKQKDKGYKKELESCFELTETSYKKIKPCVRFNRKFNYD